MHFALLTFVCVSAWSIQFVLPNAVDSESISTSRLKRSDDQNALEILIQTLSQQLSQSNARIAALEAKTNKVQQTSVAFHAEFTNDPVTLGPSAPLIFNVARTNIGKGYDILTGHFTAPVSGTYAFEVHYMGAINSVLYVFIYVDNSIVDYSISHSVNTWDHVSESLVIHLNAGQRVYLTNGEASQRSIRGGHWATFSGFLIHVDP